MMVTVTETSMVALTFLTFLTFIVALRLLLKPKNNVSGIIAWSHRTGTESGQVQRPNGKYSILYKCLHWSETGKATRDPLFPIVPVPFPVPVLVPFKFPFPLV